MMFKVVTGLIWTAALVMLGITAYAFTLGSGQLGTNALGVEGPTTTSVYTPTNERKGIIGGGIVKLEKQYIETGEGDIVVFWQLKLGEEDLK